jgi:hypothetical protein
MDTNRKFGIVMIILGGCLFAFEATGTLLPAPLILVFGTLGGLGSIGLGIWALLGKF